MQTTVWATVGLVGYHRWPQAPHHRNYLADRHRHLMQVTVEVQVSHVHREVEYHDLQDAIRIWWPSDCEFGDRSCEEIATELLSHCRRVFGGERYWQVTISEDGECGSTVTFMP